MAWTAPLVLMIGMVVLPVVAIVLLYRLLAATLLNVLWWSVYCIRGKDILFVYSDSPTWRGYLEREFLRRIKERAIVLNWSDRRRWLGKLWLPAFVFRFFGGAREYNPLAIYFRPFRRHRLFRFWQAFRDRKRGNGATLTLLESEFFLCIDRNTRSGESCDEEPVPE